MNRASLMKLFFVPAVLVASAQASALEVGDQAPCVVLKDVQPSGATVEQCIRTKEPGHAYVMLEFFSTTCGDCADNLPKLAKLAGEVAATTTTRMIGIDRNEAQIRTYVEGHRDLIQFPVALDFERSATHVYGVEATPTIYILNGTNQVIYKLVDVFNDEQLSVIKSLVK